MGATRLTNTLTSTLTTVLAVLALAGCQPATGATPDTAPQPATPVAASAARNLLAALPVRAEDTGAHYRRADWGDWTQHGRGCDTREQVLRDQGRGVTVGAGCRPGCPANVAPCWVSPYDNTPLRDPVAVQIDHRVPLKEAVRSGARTWNQQQRQRFYNDPTNLVAVSAHANTSKGDKDPGRWRPSNHATWCAYATAYVATKHTYGLTVDPAEHDGLVSMLATCR
ncbi:MAG: HNH endonuclease family protein [Labedaea sp.]